MLSFVVVVVFAWHPWRLARRVGGERESLGEFVRSGRAEEALPGEALRLAWDMGKENGRKGEKKNEKNNGEFNARKCCKKHD